MQCRFDQAVASYYFIRKRLRSARPSKKSNTTPKTDWIALTARVVSDKHPTTSAVMISNPRHSVMSRQHARLDELHSRIGCQPIFDALFPRSPGRHHVANLPACALSSYNL